MKISKIWMMAVLLGSVFCFQACKDDDENSTILDKVTFVNEATSGNMLEIQAGAMAIQKGQNVSVKQYGEHMVTDHSKASQELSAIATSKGITVPTDLTVKHKTQLSVLTNLSGAEFDKAFVDLMVASHQEQVALFERATTKTNDAELRAFATEKLPVLQAHLTEAQTLKASVNP